MQENETEEIVATTFYRTLQKKNMFFNFFNSAKHFAETSRPPSSSRIMQIIELEHMNSLACPHYTIAESPKSLCSLSPLRQSPCAPV